MVKVKNYNKMNKKSLSCAIQVLGTVDFFEIKSQLQSLLSSHLGYGVTHYGIGTMRMKNNNATLKYKELKLSTINDSKMLSLINDSNLEITAFTFTKYLSDCEYKSRDFDIYIDFLFREDFNKLFVIVNYDLRAELDWNMFFISIIKLIISNGLRINYGFATLLENSKFPGFYLDGIPSYGASQSERDLLYSWRRKQDKFQFRVFDIFWGNIITKNHIKDQDMFDKLVLILGKDKLVKITDDLFWFSLPAPMEELYYNCNNSSYIEVKSHFSNNNSLFEIVKEHE